MLEYSGAWKHLAYRPMTLDRYNNNFDIIAIFVCIDPACKLCLLRGFPPLFTQPHDKQHAVKINIGRSRCALCRMCTHAVKIDLLIIGRWSQYNYVAPAWPGKPQLVAKER
jgi:hypothetical protein